MEKEVEEANAKESLVCALKKYISIKKKAIEDGFSKSECLTWKDKFKKRFQHKNQNKGLPRS